MYVTAIDFETAHYRADSAIALGLTRTRGGEVLYTKSWLFRPPGDRIYIRRDFIDIHGITPHDLIDKPNFMGLWHDIAPHLEDTDILLAHNARFDRNVLYAVAETYGINLPAFDWVCTVDVSRRTWPSLMNHKLPTVCNHLGIGLNHHDAGSDAAASAQIYLAALTEEAKKPVVAAVAAQ